MDQDLRPVLEEDLDLSAIFNSSRDAEAEAGMLQDVTQSVAVLGGIVLRERHILPFQKHLITACPSLRRWRSQPVARFALADLSRSAGFVRLVTVLRVARVAVHSRRLVTHHGFDRVRQDAFALAAPTVNVSAWLQHGFSPARSWLHSSTVNNFWLTSVFIKNSITNKDNASPPPPHSVSVPQNFIIRLFNNIQAPRTE